VSAVVALDAYDNTSCDELRQWCGASDLLIVDRCPSTMDLAHERAAAGASHGFVVVANEQLAGRGRAGKSWSSAPASGVWASLLLRAPSPNAAGVLSLRVGIELARALDGFAASRIGLKWPNDLFVGPRKLAGVLTEARWRGDSLEWIVVGVGVNVRAAPDGVHSAELRGTARRGEVLSAIARAVVRAAARDDELNATELSEFAARDIAYGKPIVEPMVGIARGITATGGLRVTTPSGEMVAIAGSLVLRTPLTEERDAARM
jgi:BirA family transcriptional regulator, biotin operon repressor / biotin---[acetyl-CoA-carboxylase] ligase